MLKHWLRRKMPPRPPRAAPHAEWLEPRLLYSADAAALLPLDTTLAPAPEVRSLDGGFEYTGTAGAIATGADVRAAYALAPLQFERNLGQLGEGVDFAAHGVGYGVRLGGGGQAELLLAGAEDPVRLELVGANAGAPVGQDALATRTNSLVGEQARWVTDIPNYGSVLYQGVYQGVDVRYYGNQSQLEYDFIVAAGADASQLQLRFHGVDDVRIDATGDLVLRVAGTGRELRFQAPVSYQQGAAGRESVESHYAIDAEGTVRIVVGAYDSSRTLVVDPVLSHATYFGESGQETATAVAVGPDGGVYVTGQTTSSTGSFGARLPAGSDTTESFVAKFSADLGSLVYATRVGGSNAEIGNGIAIDAAGNAIVTGWTRSGDFAVTAGADQPTRAGNQLQDAFVYKLNAAGNALVFSTYFGGSGNTDTGASVAVDAAGNVYVAGTVSGTSDDAFLNKYTASGTALFKLQYGGSGDDAARGVAVDAAGNVYIAGDTLSTDDVVLNGAQATRPGADDAFLARYDSAGMLAYATYVGGSKADHLTGLAVDDSGRAYVVGRTKDPTASDFATTAGAFQTTRYAHETGFLRIYDTRLTGAASLAYSSFLGGSGDAGGTLSSSVIDSPTGVAVSGGKVAIVGHTDTSDFPTTADAVARTNTSGDNGVLVVLAPQGGGSNDLVYGTYYGTGLVTGGVAWSGSQAYLVGSTTSASGIATVDGYRSTYNGSGDGVVAVFSGFTNVAPVLSGANDLPVQLEDAAGSGASVADLVAGHLTDADGGAQPGIAVTAVDSSHGTWQFSIDGGTTWATFATPAAGSALTLSADAQTRVRFVGNANYVGASSIGFRGWDRSFGSNGAVVVLPAIGGGSAFSIAQGTASVTVMPVDDAPVRTAGSINPITVQEGSAAVSLGLSGLQYGPGGGVDEAGQALAVVVTGLPGAVGTIQLANGTPVVVGGSYTLAELQAMVFVAGRAGTASFTFGVKDDGGTANGGQDTLAQTVTLTVTNKAPVLTASTIALAPQLEDAPGIGMTVSDFLAGKVTDGGGPYGLAVVALPNGNINGIWQYSLDGGAGWLSLTGSNSSALLLGPAARLRFLGDAGVNVNGSIPGFTFRAWDGTSGIAGGTVNLGTGGGGPGGTTAFSATTATASLDVLPVNDIPVRYDVNSSSFLPAPADVTVKEETANAVSLGLGYLRYVAGYALDEYNTQTLAFTVTQVPSALGTVYLSDGVTTVAAGTSYTLAQIQGMVLRPTAGVQTGTGVLAWAVQDNGGTANGGIDTFVDQVRINVENIAPTLTGFNALPAILEDAQSAGVQVSVLVMGKLTDPSGLTGIAVTAANGAGGGTWQYSKDSGSTWASLAEASASNAVLLQTGSQWRVRFLPDTNWNSSLGGSAPSLAFRGWDRSTGTAGGTADTTVNGGTSAFSGSLQSATISVTPVNDAPVRTDVANNAAPNPLVLLDGSPMTSLGLAGIAFGPGGAADEANQTLSGSYTVSSLPAGLGTTWLADGKTQVALGASYTLAQIQGMQFRSSGIGALGTENFSFTVTDSGGTANGGVDTATFTVKVIVNRAPVLNGANSLLTVLEDFGGTGSSPQGQVPSWATPAQRAGVAVADIVSGQIVDTTGSPGGMAIVARSGGGTWQYTLDGGSTWTNLPPVANNGALLLAADTQTRVRFVPDPDWNSNMGAAGLTFRAWDQSTGIAGQLADTTYNGGASAYSAATATTIATVTSRNDAPTPIGTVVGGTVVEGAAPVPIIASGSYAAGPTTATDEAWQAVTVRFTAPIPAGVQLLMADGVTPVNPNDTTTTYTLAQFQGMLFRSAPWATPGSSTISFILVDSGGVANGGVDRASYSLALTVANQAPVLRGANPLPSLLEDTTDNGTPVSALIAGMVSDPTAARGIAVTAADNSHGSWQYSRDAGATWSALGSPGTDSARLLPADTATRVRFVPAADWNGTATLGFAAWDGTSGTAGGVADATVRGGATAFSTVIANAGISVIPVNDPPVGGGVATLTVAEDSGSTGLGLAAVGYASGGGSDEAAQTLSCVVTALPPPSFGRITLADGTDVTLRAYTLDELRGMRFVTAANATGTAVFSFGVQDSGGGSDTLAQGLAITITPVNDAPVAGFDVLAGTEDTPLTLAPATLLANDVDVDGDALAITAVASGAGGTVTLADGSIVFTPDANFNGVGSFSYTVTDGHGGTSITGVAIRLAPVNDAPVAAGDTVSGTEDQALAIAPATLLANDADVEGDALTVTAVASGAGGSVALSGGAIVFTPAPDFNGSGSFSYTVTDASGASATATVTVNVAPVNDAPVANPDTLAATEDTPLAIAPGTLLANDTDADQDPLAITAVANGTGGSVVLADGTIVFTPNPDFDGVASFSYTASDGHGGASSVTVTVDVAPVNDAPVANADSITVTAGVALTIAPDALTGNDTDAEGDALTVTGVDGAVNGTVSLVGGTIVFDPAALYSGPAGFTYTVSDGHGGIGTGTVHIDVVVGASAPIAVADSVSTPEDTPLAIDTALLLANDSDPDALDTLAVTGVSAVTGGTVTLSGNSVTFTPAADFNGPARFTYTVSDSFGATSTATVTVDVSPVNDAPVANADTVAATEDQVLTLAPATLLGNDTDADGNPLTLAGVSAVSGGTVALVGGNVVFAPARDFNGPAAFTYTVVDGNDGSATGAVTVNVAAVNDAPVAGADTVAATEDQPLTIAAGVLTANDSDVDGDALTVLCAASGTGGTVALAGGNVVFTPAANFNGTASFTYALSDGHGGTSTGAVTVIVAPVNDAPVANDDALSGTEDQPLLIAPATLLANDTDVDADTLTVTGVASGTGGTVALSGGAIVFTPAANFNGPASFSYTVSDGNGGSATATVRLDLAAVNDVPVAAPDAVATLEDQPLVITASSLTANDGDADGDALTISGVRDVVGGSVVLSGTDVVFTPAANFHGAGSFVYAVSDGHGGTSSATVTVVVASVNDAPVAADDVVATVEDTPLTIAPAALLANDADADQDALAIVGVAGASGGTVVLSGGSIVFTPAADFNGSGSFSYTVSDGQGGTATATVAVNVAPVNDAPVAQDDNVSGTEDALVVIAPETLLGNDSDAENDALAITGVAGGAGGTVSVSGNSVVFTPDANFSGAGWFTYTVDDGHGGTATGLVHVNVLPVNDAPVGHADVVAATEDTPVTIAAATLLANDTDAEGDPLAIASVSNAIGGTVVFAGGSIVFTPDADFNGPGGFTYTLSDGRGGTATATVTVDVSPVNDAPVARADSMAATEDTPLVLLPSAVLGNDTDADGDVLAIVGVASGTGGVVEYSGGRLVFTPDPDFSGTGSFSYTVGDGHGGTATTVVTVDVAPVNDVPVAGADAFAATEDTPLAIAAADLLANDRDADGDVLTLIGVTNGVGGTAVLSGGGIVFTPAADFNGVASFTYTVADGHGGTAASAVTLAVAAVDDPTSALADAGTVLEDTSASGNVLANDIDVDSPLAVGSFRIAGDPATYAAGATATIAGQGSLRMAGDGSWVFTPAADWNGTLPAVNYTTTTGVSQGLTLTVVPVNDTPVASGTPGDLSLVEGASAPLGLAGIAYGVGGGADEGASQSLTVTVNALPGRLGTVTLADGTAVASGVPYTVDQLQGMVFHAATGVSGSATFGFTVSDQAGGADTIAQGFTISVANVAPVLDGANALPAIAEDASVNPGMRVGDLLAGHASDAGGLVGIAVTQAAADHGLWQYTRDGTKWSTFDAVSATSAELLPADARIRFVPDADWNGAATGLAFRAWDASGGTAGATRADTSINGGDSPFSAASASATLTVEAVNDAPQPPGSMATQLALDAGADTSTVVLGDWNYAPGGGADEAAQSLTVVVTAVPAADLGTLVLADGVTPVQAGQSYTPQQLRGLQFIRAAAALSGSGEFAWIVRDDGGTAQGGVDHTVGSVRIDVLAQATGPLAAPVAPSAPAAAQAPSAPPAANAPQPAPVAPAPMVEAPPVPRPAATTGDALLAIPASASTMPAPAEFAFAVQRGADPQEGTRSPGAAARQLSDLQLVAFDARGGDIELLGLRDFQLASPRFTLEQFQQTLRSGAFVEELNRLRDELRQEFDLDKTMHITVAGLSLGVSVAYVLWLVRGGVLVGSYLSALPAWRLVDPLPVLAKPGEDEDEDEDDEAFDDGGGTGADPLRGMS